MKSYFTVVFFIFISFLSPLQSELPSSLLIEHDQNLEKNIQEQEESPRFQDKFIKMLSVLAFLIAIMIASLWIIKRLTHPKIALSQHSKGNKINILEIRPLSSRSTLYLIEVNGKGILVTESQTGMSTIGVPILDDSIVEEA
jgi:flagellar biogenesis protein FliO